MEHTQNFFSRFFHRPQQVAARKLLFQVHLWVGIGLGLYIFVIGLSGAAIVFLDEMEHYFHRNLVEVEGTVAPRASISKVVSQVAPAFPDKRVYAIYAPTPERQTFMVYLQKGQNFTAAFAHPVTGQALGEVDPKRSLLRWLQDLHFNLLSGRTGRVVNGVGGIFLLLLCVTGLIIWWPGVRNWRRSLGVNFRRSWKRVNWDLHSSAGFWTLLPLLMWAITGIYFGFPAQFRDFVSWFSPVTFKAPPTSNPALKGKQPAPGIEAFIAKAQAASPGAEFSGVVLPAADRSPFLVFMARTHPGDFENSDYVYFDQFSGKLLWKWQRGIHQSAGDVVMSWIVPLHFGTFGGVGIKILWVVLGISPPLLFVTGAIMWWNRVLSKRWTRLQQREPASKSLRLSTELSWRRPKGTSR